MSRVIVTLWGKGTKYNTNYQTFFAIISQGDWSAVHLRRSNGNNIRFLRLLNFCSRWHVNVNGYFYFLNPTKKLTGGLECCAF